MHAPDSLTVVKQPDTDIVVEEKPPELPDPELAIVESLCQFAYAFSSVQQLSGGLVNATYRGTLCQQLPNGARTVIIKHGEEKVANGLDFTLSTIRCITEQAVVRLLNNALVQLKPHKQIPIRIPHLYRYFSGSKTQAVEDFANDGTLHKFLSSSSAVRGDISLSTAVALGETLGKWVSCFHAWSRSCVDPQVMEIVRRNSDSTDRDVAKIKYEEIERQCGVEKVNRYAANRIFERGPNDIIVHGDFSTRNILVQNPPSAVPSSPNITRTMSLAVVDWEICCYAHHTRDVANMVSDLYMHYHFSHVDAALPMLQSFVRAYPPLDEKSRYRIVAETGEHFFLWWGYAPDTHTKEQEEEIMALGMDLIIMGNEMDREGIKKTFLGFMFT